MKNCVNCGFSGSGEQEPQNSPVVKWLFAGFQFSTPAQPIQDVQLSEQGLFLALCQVSNMLIINYCGVAGTGNHGAAFPHAKYLTD